jgi:hypothetical protein
VCFHDVHACYFVPREIAGVRSFVANRSGAADRVNQRNHLRRHRLQLPVQIGITGRSLALEELPKLSRPSPPYKPAQNIIVLPSRLPRSGMAFSPKFPRSSSLLVRAIWLCGISEILWFAVRVFSSLPQGRFHQKWLIFYPSTHAYGVIGGGASTSLLHGCGRVILQNTSRREDIRHHGSADHLRGLEENGEGGW